jgi:succinate dehydrogenase / fumarate reductase membrane anchor subunit
MPAFAGVTPGVLRPVRVSATGNKAIMRTPLKNVRRLGSAHAGTETFIRQRVTAIANVFLIPFFMWLVVKISGADYADAKALLASPAVAVGVLALILSVTVHMRIGMKEIIEDYVHGEPLKSALLLGNAFFTILLAAACGLAALKLSFGA